MPLTWMHRAAMLGSAAAYGTLLYPERRGQRPRTIDADVVILDAVGPNRQLGKPDAIHFELGCEAARARRGETRS